MVALCGCITFTGEALAGQDAGSESWNAKFQATYIWQAKNAFAAAYSGPNSLSPAHEKSYSFTSTAFFGFRPWPAGELYFNPEVAQEAPLSNLTGLGGFTNGEMARGASTTLKFNVARFFLRQTWGEEGERTVVESGQNQLAGSVAARRWVFTAGKLAVTDIFDANAYSHDPRTQFMNWALMANGAYDYPADAKGYTWGTVLEWYHDAWAVRAGRFMQPKDPNGLPIDTRIFEHYGDQVELEHAHKALGHPGKLRLLVFRGRAKMSRFQDALDVAATTGTTPHLDAVRWREHHKTGWGLNIEQEVASGVGVFVRASRSDGKTETYAFTEIDNTVSGGALVQGQAWGREQDVVGVAAVRNGISGQRQAYLARGGISAFIGDGSLEYRCEKITEVFYSWAAVRHVWLTFDWQHVEHPAYNASRGPVNFFAVRLHSEF
ncbi:carbohydrate-selective porin (OprB family) [Extensimonas vulgaris]|uniref:Carbohydrate-selective porin (OprB family) n=2 Tax=Extensimonas vulgaris TaxID=1031594 RepID=A0A369ALD4_9BURK|nr:carbohydrate-selective porin (OprB family) [Extensimonas vulgaris]TWI39777.1 carbohydrate-selective porin (OprB family) [Extensimonas vulgaris]TXD17476.1 carbohydrate porin [Extensimonas vulgaris]